MWSTRRTDTKVWMDACGGLAHALQNWIRRDEEQIGDGRTVARLGRRRRSIRAGIATRLAEDIRIYRQRIFVSPRLSCFRLVGTDEMFDTGHRHARHVWT